MHFFKKITILCLLLLGLSAQAAHLVGGDISYKCLGAHKYEVTLTIYRDCASSGAPFDNPAVVTIYDGVHSLKRNMDIFYRYTSQIPLVAPNNCTSLPSFVCTEKAVYVDTVTLPVNNTGYTITYQRCCRNNTISNVPNPGDHGSTFTIDIPPQDMPCNSSPYFNAPPPVALCLNVPVDLDLSASEPDGDSLVYSLCDPLLGGGKQQNSSFQGVVPDPAAPPPYQSVPFSAGYSAQNPIPGSPGFSIDPNTGQLSGMPTAIGQYVFAICVTEYRNGQAISVLRRDFQFNVTAACKHTSSSIVGQDIDSTSKCNGRTVNFGEQCVNTKNYFWDFGDPSSISDTSILKNPSYTYPDTGVYRVMLIANPSSKCADTSFEWFEVYDPVSVRFEYNEEPCFDLHTFDFEVFGQYSDSATFSWSFGGSTSLGTTASVQEPRGIRFSQPGSYAVTVHVEDIKCSARFTDTIGVYARPKIAQSVANVKACAPATVAFNDSSTYFGKGMHRWNFGDGTFSNKRSPVHVYTESGTYTIVHSLVTTQGCRDTLFDTLVNAVEVWPTPTASMQVNPTHTDIYAPDILVTDSLYDAQFSSTILFPDGSTYQNLESRTFTAPDTGWYEFVQVVSNEFGCSDTATFNVYVEEPFNIYIPSAFSPNGDGVNDLFKYVVTGASEHVLEIYTRWGELVFKSNATTSTWDGHSIKTGEKLPGGVYTYVLIARNKNEGKEKTVMGTVNIIH